jgi:hypothetical protein
MPATYVEIQKPIWGGGTPKIGVADFRLGGANAVRVKITYRRKDGRESYPGFYEMSVKRLMTYPKQTVGSGVQLYVAPLYDWEYIPDTKMQAEVLKDEPVHTKKLEQEKLL